jgi:hypothetical protein
VLVLASEALVPLAPKLKRTRNLRRSVVVLALTALGAAILHGLEAAVWATLYLGIGALTSVQNAMLYSLGAITSYGHAEIFLEDRWKLLGAIEAVNGLILFGSPPPSFSPSFRMFGRTISPPESGGPRLIAAATVAIAAGCGEAQQGSQFRILNVPFGDSGHSSGRQIGDDEPTPDGRLCESRAM